jgi:hypothetical protein
MSKLTSRYTTEQAGHINYDSSAMDIVQMNMGKASSKTEKGKSVSEKMQIDRKFELTSHMGRSGMLMVSPEDDRLSSQLRTDGVKAPSKQQVMRQSLFAKAFIA